MSQEIKDFTETLRKERVKCDRKRLEYKDLFDTSKMACKFDYTLKNVQNKRAFERYFANRKNLSCVRTSYGYYMTPSGDLKPKTELEYEIYILN